MHFLISTTSCTLIYFSCCHSSPYLQSYILSSFTNNTTWNLALIQLLSCVPTMLFTDTHPSILNDYLKSKYFIKISFFNFWKWTLDNMNYEFKVHVITGISPSVYQISASLASYVSSQESEDLKLHLWEWIWLSLIVKIQCLWINYFMYSMEETWQR